MYLPPALKIKFHMHILKTNNAREEGITSPGRVIGLGPKSEMENEGQLHHQNIEETLRGFSHPSTLCIHCDSVSGSGFGGETGIEMNADS